MDDDTTNERENTSNNKKQNSRRKDKKKKTTLKNSICSQIMGQLHTERLKDQNRRYDNDNRTQQHSEQLKDQNFIHGKKIATNTGLTDLQRTILQQYNKQGGRKRLKNRNKIFHKNSKHTTNARTITK